MLFAILHKVWTVFKAKKLFICFIIFHIIVRTRAMVCGGKTWLSAWRIICWGLFKDFLMHEGEQFMTSFFSH